MKKISFLILLTSLFVIKQAKSQDYLKTQDGLSIKINHQLLQLYFYGPDVVRVLKSPDSTLNIQESLSVIVKPSLIDFTVVEKDGLLELLTSSLKINIDLENGKMSFKNLDNKLLLQEKEAAIFTSIKDIKEDAFKVKQTFKLEKDEVIYGLGQQQSNQLNQRNQTLILRQKPLHIAIPIIQSNKGYGVFWDNYSTTVFKDDTSGTSFDSEIGQNIDYYFMYGKSGDGVISKIRMLTGQAPMNPLWTYGFWQSRERYRGQDELLGVLKKYRALKVPLDGIIQDWQYWGENANWNAMNFENPKFYDGKAMIDEVHQLNAHFMISVWSSFGPKTKPFQELKEKNMILDFETYPAVAKVYDAYHPMARYIYWKNLNHGLFAKGVDAWWMDSTEPDHYNIKEQDFDQNTYLGSFRKVRNAFPLMATGGVYQQQRALTSAKRVFILTRCAFAGQQRYAANSWSGDVIAEWDTFDQQIASGLNFSMCGIPYWNTDIGGFSAKQFDKGVKNLAYQELYTRWFQFGTFTPMTRSHGTGGEKEIYQFGDRGNWVFDSEEKYIHLRYRLLPYLYATAWDVTNLAGSFMRPLFMDFNEDKKAHTISNQYLFGKSFMVTPVTSSMYIKDKGPKHEDAAVDFSTIKKQAVYLPKGSTWFDFWTGEKLEGGQTIERNVPIDIIPLHIPTGTILPLAQKMQYATEKKWDELEVRIYTGKDGKFMLYEDENDNYNYEKGVFSEIEMLWNDQTQTLTIGNRKGEFPGMLKERTFKIIKVNRNHGIGVDSAQKFDAIISYKGKAKVIKL